MKTAEEKILEITEKINRQIIENISCNEVLNDCSWGAQVGVLISTNDAKKLLEYASLKEDSTGQYELEKLYGWIKEEKPKPAITAFTSGLARNIASEIESQRSSKINKRRILFQFFLWFRTNGELYVDKSIEDMIDIYLSELPSPPKTENK